MNFISLKMGTYLAETCRNSLYVGKVWFTHCSAYLVVFNTDSSTLCSTRLGVLIFCLACCILCDVCYCITMYCIVFDCTALYCIVDRVSSVGIATAYRLDGPGIESRCGRDFPHLSRPALGPTQPPVQ